MKLVKTKKAAALQQRAAKFAEELKPYLPEYGRDMLNEFYMYWTEPNRSNSKMRFELQPVFSIPHRLATWSRNSRTYGTAGKPSGNRQSAQELKNYVVENLKNQGLI